MGKDNQIMKDMIYGECIKRLKMIMNYITRGG